MVREGRHVVLIERLESLLPVRTVRQIGARAPLHVASNGKAILAALPKADREAYVSGELEPYTSQSLRQPEALRADLELTARRGFALSDGELDLEVRAVAAAILSGKERPVGAMSISCPAQRLPPERVEQFGLLVAAAARRVSERFAEA
jgi:IclR family acetate operon transcriptional repressor